MTIKTSQSGKKLTQDQIIAKFNQVHGDTYDYSSVVYVNAHTKIKIICQVHGEFLQAAYSHSAGHRCPKCAGGAKLSAEYIVQRFTDIHQNKYDYSRVQFSDMNSKIEIICHVHGSFWQKASNHYNKAGCPSCAGKNITTDQVIERFNDIHQNKYDYSLVNYSDMNTKVEIICPTHGAFLQVPVSHLAGHGCSKCVGRVSKMGMQWLNSLNLSTLIYEYSLPENRRRLVDAYDPTTNTVYQFHGDYWHGNPAVYDNSVIHIQVKKTMGELFERTRELDQQLRDWGYNLVVMWESEWKNYLSSRNDLNLGNLSE